MALSSSSSSLTWVELIWSPAPSPPLRPFRAAFPSLLSNSRRAGLGWGPGGPGDSNRVITDSGGTWRSYLRKNHNVRATSAVEIRGFKAWGLKGWGQGRVGENEGRAVAIPP